MRVSKIVVKERVARFLSACRARGLKITHQRLEIYRELASTAEHPDALMLHRRIRKRLPTVSLDTVYRNLKLLESHGLIRIVGLIHDRLRFDANIEPHHHFTCVKCWKIRDFHSGRLDGIAYPAEVGAFGKPLAMHIEVRGLCKSCCRS